jgi:pheromone shutdown protein TraB
LKHGLRDEAQLIELEEMRLMRLLQEEERRSRKQLINDQIKGGKSLKFLTTLIDSPSRKRGTDGKMNTSKSKYAGGTAAVGMDES